MLSEGGKPREEHEGDSQRVVSGLWTPHPACISFTQENEAQG